MSESTELDGAALIAAERRRQVAVVGWTPDHDDKRQNGELLLAAGCYVNAAVVSASYAASNARLGVNHDPMVALTGHNNCPWPSWPWGGEWWKPSADPVRNAVKAGALIAAEIDRLQRAEGDR